MKYLGDVPLSSVVRGFFNTRKADGTPITLGGTPSLSVYKSNSTTQTTTGVSLTVDFDSLTGLHFFTIDTSSDGTFYSTATDFRVVITTGTVDSISVVGVEVACFSVENRSALRPTTAGRTLDVSSTGEAGIDLANVGSPTTTLNLSGTTIKTATDVETDTADIQTRIPAALVSGRIDASVGAMASGVVTATAIAADAITDAKVASDVTIASVTGAVGSVTGNVGGNVVGSVASVTAAVTVGTINANAVNASALATDAVTEIQSGLATAANLAIVAGYLDTEIASILTIANKLDSAIVLDGAVYQFTANALELAPSGGGGGLDAAGVRAAIGLASANLDTQLDALPTNAELATALGTADDATLAAIASVASTLTTILGLIDTEIAAIKTKTDGLPADTAASLTSIAGYVDSIETEVAKIIKSGESRTYARSGETSITFTETRA